MGIFTELLELRQFVDTVGGVPTDTTVLPGLAMLKRELRLISTVSCSFNNIYVERNKEKEKERKRERYLCTCLKHKVGLNGSIMILSDLAGKNVFANGMDFGLLFAQVQQLQQTIVQQHEWIAGHDASLSSLQAMVAAQQHTITQQQSVIDHQQETMAAQYASLSSLQSIVTNQQQTIAQLLLTLTTVTGCTFPSLNSTILNMDGISSLQFFFNSSSFSSTIPDIRAGLSQLNNTVSSLSHFVDDVNRNASILSTSTIPSTSVQLAGAQKVCLSQVYAFISQLCALGSSSSNDINIAMPLQQQISTNGAVHWEFFTIGNTCNLAVANDYSSNSLNIASNIYGLVYVLDLIFSSWTYFEVDRSLVI